MAEDKMRAEIGVFGGSGFYALHSDVVEVAVETPYGAPSSRIAIGNIEGRRVAFLPRHGKNHELPPHKINYRANIWAMKELGVTQIIGPCAAGSLHPHVKPGDFVFCDQFVDRTSGRIDTFYEGPIVTHVSAADPFCDQMRAIGVEEARHLGINVFDGGTVVIIQGPRFSTKSESRWFAEQGWEVINMTQYPEAYLARELEICYMNVSLITDYDAGLEGHPEVKPVTYDEVIEIFNANNTKVRDLIYKIIPRLPTERTCACASALSGARLEG